MFRKKQTKTYNNNMKSINNSNLWTYKTEHFIVYFFLFISSLEKSKMIFQILHAFWFKMLFYIIKTNSLRRFQVTLYMSSKISTKQKYYLNIFVSDLLPIPLVNSSTRFRMASHHQKLQICSSILHIKTTQTINTNLITKEYINKFKQ